MDRSSLLALGRTIAPAADRTGKYRTPRSFRLPRFDAPASPPGRTRAVAEPDRAPVPDRALVPPGVGSGAEVVRVDGTHDVRGPHELSGTTAPRVASIASGISTAPGTAVDATGVITEVSTLLPGESSRQCESGDARSHGRDSSTGARSLPPFQGEGNPVVASRAADRPGWKSNPFAPAVEERHGSGRAEGDRGAATAATRERGADPGSARLPHWVEQVVLALVRPGNRRRGTRAIQTEMNLETVKVVRNDLSTADVEVMVGGGAARPEGLSAACRGRVLKLWWAHGARNLRRLGHLLF